MPQLPPSLTASLTSIHFSCDDESRLTWQTYRRARYVTGDYKFISGLPLAVSAHGLNPKAGRIFKKISEATVVLQTSVHMALNANSPQRPKYRHSEMPSEIRAHRGEPEAWAFSTSFSGKNCGTNGPSEPGRLLRVCASRAAPGPHFPGLPHRARDRLSDLTHSVIAVNTAASPCSHVCITHVVTTLVAFTRI